MDLIVLDVASAYVVEVEFEIIAWRIAVLGNEILIVLTAAGDRPVIGGIGHPIIIPLLPTVKSARIPVWENGPLVNM